MPTQLAQFFKIWPVRFNIRCCLYGTRTHKSTNMCTQVKKKKQVNDPMDRAENINPASCTSSNHAPPARGEKEGERRLERRDGSAIFSSYLLIQREKNISQEPPLSHAERCRGMPEVQRRLAGMKSFASGANRRLLFISSAYRFAVVIFGDAEGHLKEFLMGLWCEKQGDLLCWCSLLILNEHISPPASVQLDISTFPPPAYWRGL